jgi:hypothetical protein
MKAIADYVISQEGLDWSKLLQPWGWLLPPTFTLWIVTKFVDCFLVLPDGSVHWLDVSAGQFTKVAASREEFCEKSDDDEQANFWFAMTLVDDLVANGVTLDPGSCYGFKKPVVLGGGYEVDNVYPASIEEYLWFMGDFHLQIRDVPDGGTVEMKVVP